ncbi:MAG: hypothetical protein C0622_10790 [Desulfuromonas sp.]|nr:MAG: hypothetical protein C0622_10790 [Desulfuromonas sp.]
MPKTEIQDFMHLSERAEAFLAASEVHSEAACHEARALIHALTVRQAELEARNDELTLTQKLTSQKYDELFHLYHQTPIAYLTVSIQGKIEQTNATFAKLIGVSPEKLIGCQLSDFVADEERDAFLRRFDTFCQHPEGKELETLFCPVDGDYFYGRLSASFHSLSDKNGSQPYGLLLVIQDITEQRNETLNRLRAETALDDHDAFLTTLLNTIPVPVYYLDNQGCYLGCNLAHEEMLGFAVREIVGKRASDIFPAEFATVQEQENIKLLATGTYHVGECQIRTADGNLRDVVCKKAVFRNSKGEIAGIVGAILDITKQREVQEYLLAAQKAADDANRLKREFLANMSHEIRTPMNGVIGMAEILCMTELTPDQKKYVNLIRAGSTNLLAIINDILDFSKIESNRISLMNKPFSLRSVVDRSVSSVLGDAEKKRLTLDVHYDPDVADLFIGDAGRLSQVLLNLLSNAVKFTSTGGVRVSISSVDGGVRKTTLNFCVVDTGIGIHYDSLHKLFTPFTQVDGSLSRKFGGTGLGLSISKKLIELMGGRIEVESVEGKGSTFCFDLPVMPVEQSSDDVKMQAPQAKPALTHQPKNCRLLLVEDNQINREAMSLLLKRLGYQVTSAQTGGRALELLRQQNFELVLLDCMLPDLSGYQVTREIRNPSAGYKNSNIPIVAITGQAMNGDRERCLESGMNDYLAKPITHEQLTGVLSRWLSF